MSFTLLHGDCLDKMSELSDGSIDAIITDIPYGTTALPWDSVIPLPEMWEQLTRIIKPYGAIVLFSSQPFTTTLISSNIKNFKYCWVWEKTKAGNFQQAPNSPLKKHEDICVFSSGTIGHKSQSAKRMPYNPQGVLPTNVLIKRNKNDDPHGYQRENGILKGYQQTVTNYPGSILKYNSVHNPQHPTQKPVELIEYLIKTYTTEGETVLDFTMGSGTTGVACINTNRNFVGIELDQKYFDAAKDRLTSFSSAPQLPNSLFE